MDKLPKKDGSLKMKEDEEENAEVKLPIAILRKQVYTFSKNNVEIKVANSTHTLSSTRRNLRFFPKQCIRLSNVFYTQCGSWSSENNEIKDCLIFTGKHNKLLYVMML